MTYGDFKDLPKRTTFGKVSRDKAFNIAKNPNYEHQKSLASMVYSYLVKKVENGAVKSKNMLN